MGGAEPVQSASVEHDTAAWGTANTVAVRVVTPAVGPAVMATGTWSWWRETVTLAGAGATVPSAVVNCTSLATQVSGSTVSFTFCVSQGMVPAGHGWRKILGSSMQVPACVGEAPAQPWSGRQSAAVLQVAAAAVLCRVPVGAVKRTLSVSALGSTQTSPGMTALTAPPVPEPPPAPPGPATSMVVTQPALRVPIARPAPSAARAQDPKR